MRDDPLIYTHAQLRRDHLLPRYFCALNRWSKPFNTRLETIAPASYRCQAQYPTLLLIINHTAARRLAALLDTEKSSTVTSAHARELVVLGLRE